MSSLTAAGIYALSQGARCQGTEECHYCGSACGRVLLHGEAIQIHLGRPAGGVRLRPGNPYVCVGCWHWKRKKLTASFLSGGYKDGATPAAYSWFCTTSMAWALTHECGPKLYECLLKPPETFFLAVLDGDKPPDNLIQTAIANHQSEPKADQLYRYTINNVIHAYTVYELEQAALHGVEGREPGVQALLRMYGKIPAGLVAHVATDPPEDEKRDRGRPIKPEAGRPHDTRRPLVKKN